MWTLVVRNRVLVYARAVLVVVVCSIIAALLQPRVTAANLSMIFLAGIVFTAFYYGRGPSILATVLSVGVFDFVFIEPYGTLAISDVQYVITLFVMLLVAITVSSLAVRSRRQTEAAKERERQTASLYAMSRKFSDAQNLQALLEMAAHHVANEFNGQVTIFMPDNHGQLQAMTMQPGSSGLYEANLDMAARVFTQGQIAETNPDLYVPLRALKETVGVLAINPQAQFALPERRQLLTASADQIGLAIEQLRLAEQARQAQMEAETERLRNNLLSSVSHDLRTPLAAITGATSTLLERGLSLDPQTHQELSNVAYEEAQRLNRLVGNLLDMTRLESGGLKVEKEWQTLEEVVGVALRLVGKQHSNHPFVVQLPPELPFVPMDSVLIEQVLVNLLENAIKYTPVGTPIEVTASSTADAVTVQVADHGPGIPAESEERIFDKFYRASPKKAGGVGLGLAICKGIVEAHSGSIEATNRPEGGAVFSFTLPLGGVQPELHEDV